MKRGICKFVFSFPRKRTKVIAEYIPKKNDVKNCSLRYDWPDKAEENNVGKIMMQTNKKIIETAEIIPYLPVRRSERETVTEFRTKNNAKRSELETQLKILLKPLTVISKQ